MDTTEGISLHSFTQSKLAQTRNGGSEARNLITLLGKIVVFIPVGCFGFPGGSDGKASACNAGNSGSIPGLGRSPGEGKGYPTPVFWPREFHGLYSPWGSQSNFHFPSHRFPSVPQLKIARVDTQTAPLHEAPRSTTDTIFVAVIIMLV